ncbi:hypothetical protein [Absidia glauca]|uniref:Uncharacterized protein n=1 Tax=Absidia glauca TaxID=4829 RepID=A0A168P8S5_ABSGL|nr:hypothetical protein [Absidia glauca]
MDQKEACSSASSYAQQPSSIGGKGISRRLPFLGLQLRPICIPVPKSRNLISTCGMYTMTYHLMRTSDPLDLPVVSLSSDPIPYETSFCPP